MTPAPPTRMIQELRMIRWQFVSIEEKEICSHDSERAMRGYGTYRWWCERKSEKVTPSRLALATLLGFRHWILLCQAQKLLMPTRFRAASCSSMEYSESWKSVSQSHGDLKAEENSAKKQCSGWPLRAWQVTEIAITDGGSSRLLYLLLYITTV